MLEFGVVVSDEAVKSLFEYYASSGGPKDGQELNFDQYIIMMRGYLNPQRRNLVHRAFRKMDRDGSGGVDWHDLKGVYNVAQHPKVLTGTPLLPRRRDCAVGEILNRNYPWRYGRYVDRTSPNTW